MQAITEGQSGSMVYVVKPDNTVETRQVVTNRSGAGFAVIEKGLVPGEVVVTDGQTRLTRGARVQIKSDVTDAAAATTTEPN